MARDTGKQLEQKLTERSKEDSKEQWTQFGYAFACLGLAVFCFVAPSFFKLKPVIGALLGNTIGSTASITFSAACYVVGIIFAFFTVSFLATSFDKHPEVRTYLRSLFGGSADAWESALGAVSLMIVASIVHLLALVLDISGLVALLIKFLVYFIGFMGFVLGISAVDSLVFKPFLRNITERPPDKAAVSQRAKKIAVAIGSVVASLVTLPATLSELTR